jgi:hypothetical protein
MIVLPACSGGDDDATALPSAEEQLTMATRGLCEAMDLAADGDVPGAERAFQDRVHAYLHDLADRVATFDRPAAAELLVAKQRVEEALRRPEPGPDEVASLLEELQRELSDAADAAGLPPASCTEGATP